MKIKAMEIDITTYCSGDKNDSLTKRLHNSM